ncbi:hypothetical protein Pmar_PMAR026365 [Perkinsus marinus ATCC 50983]|uniref:Uncharacterized protein n=1 Tax=Perkinsus marinus (strain ATCC 50983 / TXsc) TaxID=423536 RepID=C5LEJ5_PERM5|nr:hypothetical protein Pmar_PMAR026365 [Perkinsus marinus ATCC 50983]EER04813.1 hypothetical protein Pmar_PMAR026365 [Perkinsus marinus ATCC 50983]|eukprot:XP_002772997.1 hypothetical protein Pmar_PMAR026365 [Perkinsus marinus ATCC 50983]
MFVRISVATIALISLAEGIVVGRSTGDEKPLFGSIDNLELTPELINQLKELETELIKQDEKRIASYPEGPQLAAVSADGSFSYPPGCTPDERPKSRYYCFHGKRTTTGKEKEVTAIVDLFDVNDPQDNVVIGFTTEFAAKTAKSLDLHAGGEAEVVTFGKEKKRISGSLSLATYDVESPKPGLLGREQKNMAVNMHLKLYVHNFLVMDIEHVPTESSYTYATNAGNMGFNVTGSVTKKIKFGTVGGSLHLTLDTTRGNDSIWYLKGTAKAFCKTTFFNVNFPVTFLGEKITLP